MLQSPICHTSGELLDLFEDILSWHHINYGYVLPISDMAESKLPLDFIAFLTSKLARATAELLPSMS